MVIQFADLNIHKVTVQIIFLHYNYVYKNLFKIFIKNMNIYAEMDGGTMNDILEFRI